jgi:hypothetical protein
MGGGGSKHEQKTRNHSIAEFEFLLDTTANNDKKSDGENGPNTSSTTVVGDNISSKLKILQKAKQNGSFVSKKDILALAQKEVSASINPDNNPTTVSVDSLRRVPPPKSEGTVAHPAKWLFHHPDLTLCLDSHGNTYYYNYNTQESSWDPPEDLRLPKSEITFRVVVPDGTVGGSVFNVEVNGEIISVMCPIDLGSGSVLELTDPNSCIEGAFETSDASGSVANNDALEEVEVFDGNIESYDIPPDDDQDQVQQEAVPPVTVDDDTVWEALAQTASMDPYTIKADSEMAINVLQEVANGLYLKELIIKLGWAYKFNLLKNAARACYLSGGNFLDSSQYDNCDGTPRYDQMGFVEWLEDLQKQRAELMEAIRMGNLNIAEEPEDQAAEEYARLASLSGDDAKLLEGIMLRRKQVETELDNYRSR